MVDREKVIRKLEELLVFSRYNDSVGWNPDNDTETLEGALALLKAQEPHYPICERCGKPINHIKTSVFQYDGTDSEYQMPLTFDEKTGCVAFETSQNWTGYELDDEERKEDIRCPNCGEYPFDSNVEIEFHEPVEVLMWTSRPSDEVREATPWE